MRYPIVTRSLRGWHDKEPSLHCLGIDPLCETLNALLIILYSSEYEWVVQFITLYKYEHNNFHSKVFFKWFENIANEL